MAHKLTRILVVYFLVVATLLVSAPRARAAAPMKIQSCTANSSVLTGYAPAICTLTGVAAGHSIVGVTSYCGPTSGVTFTDTFGIFSITVNTQIATGASACNLRQNVVALYAAKTGTNSGTETISITPDGTSNLGAFVLFEEWDSPFTLDQNTGAFATSGGAGTISSGNVTTGSGGEFLIAGGLTAGGTTLTAGSGYTINDSYGPVPFDYGFGQQTLYIETQVAGAAGSYAGTFAQSGAALWFIVFGTFGITSTGSIRHRAIEY